MNENNSRAEFLKRQISDACGLHDKFLEKVVAGGLSPEEKRRLNGTLEQLQGKISKFSSELSRIVLRDRGMLPADPHETRPTKPVRFFGIEIAESGGQYATAGK